ncbi:MAG: hypothetical protein ACYCX2_06170 [Christensenellales bacterium]
MKEYGCFIEFAGLKGEGKLILGDDELSCLSLFDQYAIPYTDITSFESTNYRLIVQTEHGPLTASGLGNDLAPFYLQLYEKYNEKVLKALFVDGKPLLEARGEYSYQDEGGSASGTAYIKLFERCLCILPPDGGGRRVPLCFVQAIDKGSFWYKLTLDTGETYELIRLGRETQPFEDKLNECMYKLRQNAVDAALSIDASLNAMQSAQIARLMVEGVPAPVGRLSAISPSFTHAIEEKIKTSRANETYLHFKEVCDPKEILVGTKSYLAGEDQKDVLWIIAPRFNTGGGVAALEMALSEDTAAATFLYRFSGGWEPFWRRLNHAIEAINFKREVISVSDEELNRKENALYKMAVTRTASLQFLRKCFFGRIIHATMESWKRDLAARFN